jgi:serine/threonine protein kinase
MKGPLSQLGRFHIQSKIASGGMASVYRARMDAGEGFSKVTALKILHPHLSEDEDCVAMFLDEGRLCARLNHPNLVSAFDFGSLDGYRYMAMEYHPGSTLASVLDALRERGERLELGWVVYLLREVLRGLAFAHALTDDDGQPLGVVHRDISPDNVLVTDLGEVKVLDFGIAKGARPRPMSGMGMVKGKAGYMPPEQASGGEVDPRADLYSVAVLGCELLTGEPPPPRTAGVSRKRAGEGGTNELVPPPSRRCPPRLHSALSRAANPDPTQRFADAAAFAEALDGVLAELDWDPDRAALGAVVQELRDSRPEPMPKERGKRARAKAAVTPTPLPEAPAQGREEVGALAAGAGVGLVSDDGERALRWIAWAVLAVFLLGLLLEIFGVTLDAKL